MLLANRLRCVVSGPTILATLGVLPLAWAGASAQTSPRPPAEVPYLNFPRSQLPERARPSSTPAPEVGSSTDSATANPAGDIKQREQELEAIRAEQKRALENEARLKREAETIGDDRRKLNQQLIDVATRVRTLEDGIAGIEQRLAPLDERERALRESLAGRRHVVAEVLAALQRIGRRPPPAILVKADDALDSVRSAMLLGAVLPEMRQETQSLVADLAELARLRTGIAAERASLARDLATLGDDRQRLTALIDQRQKQQTEAEGVVTAERQRASELGRQADDVQELIAKLGHDLDSAARNSGNRAGDEKKSSDSRVDLAALHDPGRLAPAIAFASAKKQLPLPVNGVRIREFNASDGVGGTEKGLSIASRPGAQVTAPCDGWVVYAGPFRNYGQLLILNAGGGYHVLLAGMERISVDLGQFVVTGEPVAVMGGRVQPAIALTGGSGQPVLYVEFRRDGTPVDPSPWWATSDGEKARG
jgi:septal ring factor EnvC (AmiA/AmiB activator)